MIVSIVIDVLTERLLLLLFLLFLLLLERNKRTQLIEKLVAIVVGTKQFSVVAVASFFMVNGMVD